MKFKDLINKYTPYTFVYITFENDTFVFDKNYAAKYQVCDHRFNDCDVVDVKPSGEFDIFVTLRKEK